MNGIVYEIHTMTGLDLLNRQLVKIGLRPSRIFYENDFAKNLWKGFLRHPVILTSLYKSSLLNVAGRVVKRKSVTNESDAFEPGMQCAFRMMLYNYCYTA